MRMALRMASSLVFVVLIRACVREVLITTATQTRTVVTRAVETLAQTAATQASAVVIVVVAVSTTSSM